MHRPLPMILMFLGVILLVAGGSHYFLWTRLVRATSLQAPWPALVTALLVTGALVMPASLIVHQLVDAPWSRALAFVGYVWMGLAFFLLVGLGAADVLHLGDRLFATWRSLEPNPERRLFLARTFGGGVAAFTAVAGTAAVRSALTEAKLVDVIVALKKLPKSLHGLTIVQISDLHVGPTIRGEVVQALVARVNALQPDIVVLTGDLVDGSVSALSPEMTAFKNLQSRHGVFFVTGNHEYYSGVDEWIAWWRQQGVTVLRNERVAIGVGNDFIDIAGVDDWHAERFGRGHGHDMAKAMTGRDPDRAVILLAHQPKSMDEAVAHNVDLQLSGHTHGGQLWPFSWLVGLQQPYIAGLAQQKDTQIYVSRGTGYWGPPMRLGAPSELTRIVLHAA
jgi:predicted MPP superfamily phosphohydrolase